MHHFLVTDRETGRVTHPVNSALNRNYRLMLYHQGTDSTHRISLVLLSPIQQADIKPWFMDPSYVLSRGENL